MDELNAWKLTLRAWWRVGVLASVVWAVGAAFAGSSMLSLVAAPLLVWMWVFAIFVVDRWVRKGAEQDW
jgi:hypothetical protein